MKIIITSSLLLFFSFFSCKTKNGKEVAVTSVKIENFLSDKQLHIISNYTEIELYAIKKQLIEGTKDEYTNKAELVKKLSKEQEKKFLGLFLNDHSYWWTKEPTGNFDPTQQLIIKNEDSQFLILFSEKNKELSIIDLEGQKSLLTKFTKIEM